MIIGIAGMIAAGKSTFARHAEQNRRLVFDDLDLSLHHPRVVEVDQIGHQRLADPVIALQIITAFGKEVAEHGVVDRARLAQIALASPSALARLETIIHPPMLADLRAIVAEAREQPGDLLVVAALPRRFAFAELCDRVIVLPVTRAEAQQRLLSRSPLMTPAAFAVIWQRQLSEYPCRDA